MSARHHLVVGLPGSGKTTFIAALWHVVISEEIASALQLSRLDGDRTHLNKIRESWLRCEPVPRTSQQVEPYVRMLLKDAAEHVAEVWFPDMSGESFRDHWEYRLWSARYDSTVEQTDSVMLFVHPDKIIEPLRIATVNAMASAIPSPVAAPNGTAPAPPRPWDPKQTPTQVQLVELLQFLRWRKPGRPWAVSIIVSAWDVVRNLGQTPHAWCSARLPLLEQFLRANTKALHVRYYGLSAQGGELPGDAARLRAVAYASERIEVVREGRASTSDITVILRDLLDEDGS